VSLPTSESVLLQLLLERASERADLPSLGSLNDRRQAQRRARRNKATEWEPFPSVWRCVSRRLNLRARVLTLFPRGDRSLVVQLVNWPLVPARCESHDLHQALASRLGAHTSSALASCSQGASYYFGLTDEERDAISLASLDEDPKKRQRKYRYVARDDFRDRPLGPSDLITRASVALAASRPCTRPRCCCTADPTATPPSCG
jgi:hypothetical protein